MAQRSPLTLLTEAANIGFPHGLPLEKGPYVSYGGESLLYSDDTIHGRCSFRHRDGNSGSPILDTKGNLIGIFSGRFQSIQRVNELVDEL